MSRYRLTPEEIERGRRSTIRIAQEERASRYAEIDHLLASGETPESIAAWFGVNAGSIARQARRHKERMDIARRFSAAEARERRSA